MRRFRAGATRGRDRRAEDLQDLVEQKDVGEQGSQVKRSVEVVHQLGADPGLGEHQADRRQRLAGVAGEHLLEVVVPVARGDRLGDAEARECPIQTVERRGESASSTRILPPSRPLSAGRPWAANTSMYS